MNILFPKYIQNSNKIITIGKNHRKLKKFCVKLKKY